MRFGSLELKSNLFLSRLAGYTNLPFRLTLREIGGLDLATTDLVNARSLVEHFRGDADRGFLLGGLLSFSQGVSIGLAIVAIVLFALVPRWLKATPPSPPTAA